MGASLDPSTFNDPRQDTITAAQAAMLKAKGIVAGISSGLDEHWIEDWLFAEWGINVDNLEELTVGQFRAVLEGMGWDM
jgi:hypothetical protein